MPEPSYSELIHTPADPERGTGTPAVVIPDHGVLQALQSGLQHKAQQDRFLYQDFQNRLAGMFEDLKGVNEMDMAPGDREALTKKAGEIFGEIEKDPRAFFGGGNVAKMGEIQKKIGELKGEATQSKQDNLFDKANRIFLQSNPSMQNDKNKKTVEGYLSAPLGKRKPYTLEMPGLFDPAALAKSAAEIAKKPFVETGLSADGKYVESRTGVRYDPEKYGAVTDQMYDMPDQTGRPLSQTIQERYAQIPDYMKQKYANSADPAKEWYRDTMKVLRPEDSVTKGDIKPNQFALETQKQQGRIYLEAIKAKDSQTLAVIKENLKHQTTPQQANFLLNTYADLMGNTHGSIPVMPKVGGPTVNEAIVDVPADLLRNYAEGEKATIKSGGQFDEITETIISGQTSDLLTTRTKNGDLRVTSYKHYKKGDVIPTGKKEGDIVESQHGERIIQSTKVIPRRNLLAHLGKDIIEKKELAASIQATEDYLQQHHKGNVVNYINTQKQAKTKYKLDGKSYGITDLEKLGYSDQDIQRYIDAGVLEKDKDDDDDE